MASRGAALLLLVGGGALTAHRSLAAADVPLATLDVSTTGGASWGARFWAQPAAFGPLLPGLFDDATFALSAFLADDAFHFGCGNISALAKGGVGSAQLLVVARGNCSFVDKAYNAQQAGADAVVVWDSMPGKYGAAAPLQALPQVQGECDVDCAAGSFTVPGAVAGDLAQLYAGLPGPACASACGGGRLCALPRPPPGGPAPDGSRTACCVPNDLLFMGASGPADGPELAALSIPAVYLSAADGVALLGLMGYAPSRARAGGWERVEGGAAEREGGTGAGRSAGSTPLPAAASLRRWSASRSRPRPPPPPGAVGTSRAAADTCSPAEWELTPTPRGGGGAGAHAPSHAHVDGWATSAPLSGPLSSPALLRPAMRAIPSFDWASILLWAVGVGTTALAAFLSVAEERAHFAAALEGRDAMALQGDLHPHHGMPALSLTPRQATYALAGSALLLLSLYLLIHFGVPVVYFIMAMFALGATQAAALIYFYPLLDRFTPHLEGKVAFTLPARLTAGGSPASVSVSTALAYGSGALLVLVWFTQRHAPGAFFLQDALGVALCCVFLASLKLPNLRTASILLGLFFAYDIFMVFLTPYIFGTSVMLDVATAGMPTAMANSDCYCRLNPGDASVCGVGEAMPILLRIPRVNDWRGGDAMLGLGDVVIPGLAVAMGARRDWAPRGPAARGAKGRVGYLPVAMGGYALGLALANVGVLMTGAGQPALLYLVPCVLAALLLHSRHCHEEEDMWVGTAPGLQRSGGEGVGGEGGGGPGSPSEGGDVREGLAGATSPTRADEGAHVQNWAQGGGAAPTSGTPVNIPSSDTEGGYGGVHGRGYTMVDMPVRARGAPPPAADTVGGGGSGGGGGEGEERQRLL